MPELPEVETIARGLDPVLRGRTVVAVVASWPRTIDARSEPVALLAGDRIGSVARIGKFVAIAMESGRTLAIHLRMTGRLLVTNGSGPIEHERAAVHFDDGHRLAFGDARKFGRIRLIVGEPARSLGIGIDPFDASLDVQTFGDLLRRRKTPIKTLLLDQRRIGGV